ncbi:MAG: hypothetical protein KBD78_08740 [Oligoflexales bacterium]|nr:hypothetical protein [Oligoflexales bacterium]
MKYFFSILRIPFIFLSFLFLLGGCQCDDNKGGFAGGEKEAQSDGGSSGSAGTGGGDGDSKGNVKSNDGMSLEFDADGNDIKGSYAWVATFDHNEVYKIDLDPAQNFKTKKWRLPSPVGEEKFTVKIGGMRTFVSSKGLFVGKSPPPPPGAYPQGKQRFGALVYFINDKIPQPVLIANFTDAKGFLETDGEPTRICLTAFTIGSVDYFGGVYDTLTSRVFFRAPLSLINSLDPKKLEDSAFEKQSYPLGDGWGYGCFTDIKNGYFWSANHPNLISQSAQKGENSPQVYGVNLANLTEIDVSLTPNAIDRKSNTYALSGDREGNVLNYKSNDNQTFYTLAHDDYHNIVYASSYDQGSIYLSEGTNCRNLKQCNFIKFSLDDIKIGPLSSTNDGRIVGVKRKGTDSTHSEIYLIEPNDPKNISSGVKAQKIASVIGDAYMYSDFTGAFLYYPTIVRSFNLKGKGEFDPSVASELRLKWQGAGDVKEWRGLLLAVRCFEHKKDAGVNFENIATVPVADEYINITATSCSTPGFDTIEIRISDGGKSEGRSKVEKIIVNVKQS